MKKTLSFLLITVICISLIISSASADVTDYAKLAAGKFKDLKSTDWYAEYVGKLNQLQIIDGYNGRFEPAGSVTRAQFMKMLVQAMGYKKVDAVSFSDIKPMKSSKPHWAAVYIETALRNGVFVKEEIGENFYPDVPLARIDMAMMMARALKLQPSTGENPFVDMQQANGYASKLYEEYLIRGTLEGGKRLYKPEGLTTRAEAAAIISRMVDYKADPTAYKKVMSDQEKYAVIPKRVYDYPVKYGDKKITTEEANKLAYENIKYYADKKGKTNGEMIESLVDLAEAYINADWNIHYSTVEKTYADSIKGLIPIDHFNSDVAKYIKIYKDNKVVQEGKLYTDRSLVLDSESGFIVRGVVKYINKKPTSDEFLKNLNGRGKKGIEVDQWYEKDVEIFISGDPMDPYRESLVVFKVRSLSEPAKISKPW